MSENRSDKKTIWLYAAILFACAFIILLLTAYSQEKFKKNISDYETKLSVQERAKKTVLTDLNSAIEENKKLTDELDTTKKELQNTKQELNKTIQNNDDVNSKALTIAELSKLLINAYDEYSKGNIAECALILNKRNDFTLLDEELYGKYKFLVDNTFVKAGEILFNRGYNYYKDEDYENAISSLNNSLSISTKEYYSDDCYYFLAYSYLRQGNKEQADKNFKVIVDNYPESNYYYVSKELLSE